MLGRSLLVKSYVVISQGCPLAITREGPDHVLIRCGKSDGESFELVAEHEALRALVELGTDALTWIDAVDQDNAPTEDRTPG